METMSRLARFGQTEPGNVAILENLSRNRSGLVVSIDSFLRRTFIYRDERDEVLRDVPFMLHDLETLGHFEGDCDDMTIMCCSLLKTAGLDCRMTAIKSANPFEFDHVFSEARVGEFWIPIDPTVPYGMTYQQYGFMSEPV